MDESNEKFKMNSNDEDNNEDIDAIELEEAEHYMKVLAAFYFYERYTNDYINSLEYQYNLIPDRHKKLVSDIPEKLKHFRSACKINYHLFKEILTCFNIYENKNIDIDINKLDESFVTQMNIDKVIGTLRQFVREWSSEGQNERDQCFKPILDELQEMIPLTENDMYKRKVLCPGSGLGRLPLEICKLGYCSQGNEFSLFMLLAGYYILNKTNYKEEYVIFPNIHQVNNVESKAYQLKYYRIPDINPSELPENADFSYTAGEFIETYKNQINEWDAICTCFFIDTAHNIIEYIEVIYNILKPGGVWINFGPLLYHYAEMKGELSLELTLDQVLRVVKEIGFVIKKHEMRESTYTRNHGTMMKIVYNCSFFTAIKPIEK